MKQKRQVKSVILETIKKQKMLSAGILTAVIGAVVAALISPLILAKIIDTVTAGNEAAFFCDPSLFCPARTYRNIGSCEGRTPDGVWSENHTCTKKQPDG